VIAALAELILPPGRFDWSALRSHRRLREEMAKVVPGFGALARIDETRREFTIAGRTFPETRFATPDGRARFHPTPLPDFAPAAGEFRLMTLRSEGQFNTVVYEEEDLYRGNRRRDVVMMAAEDAARRASGARSRRRRSRRSVASDDRLQGLLPLQEHAASGARHQRVGTRSELPLRPGGRHVVAHPEGATLAPDPRELGGGREQPL